MPELKIRDAQKELKKEKEIKINLPALCKVLSFFIPCLMLVICLIVRQAAPFGGNSLCSMDAFSQYYPMLENMSRALKDGELFYSFSGSLGFNLWVQSAYYTNSPLWLILYLLPESFHITAIDLLVMLRFSLASLFFCIRLNSRRKVTAVKLLPYTALSCAYALCGYMTAFINQFMWADAVVLLPLIMLGLEKLNDNKRPFLYIITLFLCIWSCFYTGYMVCLFCVLYMLYLLLSEKRTAKDRFFTSLRFGSFSLVAGGMAAVTLIPVFKAILLTKATSLGFERLELYKNFFSLLRNLLPFSDISLEYGAPNVYCGIVTVVLAVALLFSKRLPCRKRIVAFAFSAFMLLSLELNVLDYVWNGFHFPNQLPGRQSFLLIFLLLAFAAEFFENIDYSPGTAKNRVLRFLSSTNTLAVLLGVVLLFECCFSAVYQISGQTWISAISGLRRDSETAMTLSELSPGRNDFYRSEFTSSKKNNSGMQYGYNGISYYSSTMPGAAYDFFERLGMPRYAKNVSTHYTQSDILNALFGVRYIVEKDAKTVTENENRLPLIFACSGDIANLDIYSYEGAELQTKLWAAVCGNEDESVSEGVMRMKDSGIKYTRFSSSHIEGSVTVSEDGVLFASIPDDGGWRIFIDGIEVTKLSLCGYLCGAQIKSGEHTVELKYTPPGFTQGLAISAVCLLAFVFISLIYRRRNCRF